MTIESDLDALEAAINTISEKAAELQKFAQTAASQVTPGKSNKEVMEIVTSITQKSAAEFGYLSTDALVEAFRTALADDV